MSETNPESASEPQWYSPQQLQEIVKAFVQQERQTYDAQMKTMQASIDSLSKSLAGTVPTQIREHGAGLGTEVHQTWSQYEQELARAAHEAELIAARTAEVAAVVLPHIPGL